MKNTAFQQTTQDFFQIKLFRSSLQNIWLRRFSIIFIQKIFMELRWHLYLMAGVYIIAGLLHFIKPKIYMRIMPRYLPAHKVLVYLSGVAEILLGAALFYAKTREAAIYGVILMLAVFLLVHFYMLSSKKAAAGFPKWILILRIPLQFFLMWWAWQYLQYI